MKDKSNMKNGQVADESEERNPDEECGLGNFRPKFLQSFANINVFVGTYSIIGLLSQTLSVYVNSQVPTLEKQFGLSSAESGLIMSCNDIGFFVTVLFVSVLARFVHIPRFLFFCIMLYGLSGIICSLPHFVAISKGLLPSPEIKINLINNAYNITSNADDKKSILCNIEGQIRDMCKQEENAPRIETTSAPSYPIKSLALALIGMGMVLQGIGKAPRGAFYTVYVDDNIDRRKTGFYTGIAIACSIFGPALAYGIGGVFSRIYVTLEDVDMNTRDPRWIGAWWLGFLIFGSLSILLSTLLIMFPRTLKQSKKDIAKGKIRERPYVPKGTLKEKIKNSALSYVRILRNPIYLLMAISSTINILSVGGYFAFLSKYIKTHFNIPLFQANFIIAGTNITSVAIGAFLGGIVTRKVKMTPPNVYKLIIVFYVLNVAFLTLGMFMSCPQPHITGPKNYISYSPAGNCSSNCQCDENEFFPICGSDGVIYHSPCYAGCDNLLRGGRMYSNCSCIPDGKATAGLCKNECKTLYPWIVFMFLSSLTAAMKITPGLIAIIRCVDDGDKPSALGFNSFIHASLGWGVSPIIFGKVVDTACLLWQNPCSSSGACELYDITKFRLATHGLSLAIKLVALALTVIIFIKVRKWPTWQSQSSMIMKDENEKLVTGTTEKNKI